MIPFLIIAGSDTCGKTTYLKFLKSIGYKTTSWHPYAKEVCCSIPGFPENPPDFGLAIDQYIDKNDREWYFKEVFNPWNLSIRNELQNSSNKLLVADSHGHRFIIKEHLLYRRAINYELLNILPKPDRVFLIELNTEFSWLLNKGNPEFYEMYPENSNSSATLEQRFKLFQTDVYNGMKSLYEELNIPYLILPNTGLPSQDKKHEIWKEIMSPYI